ncbi:TetR/AcrR family transcriptional regulator [Kitasatospora sp. NBC_01287]|uniref:TetR/AcrR family transcriptional regulator n=1 Tax=Kitasatospora sp. NBC_01287 TaxID=2903573 RepID=UPI0022526450|nr:TetR/AcrR family transcriptional regulator [Kitasatospora sp. NBC_01287]MCX4747990.1 TetR/AcrR family transcriptional regulator [Kitasatospora sp. NBC_01287]
MDENPRPRPHLTLRKVVSGGVAVAGAQGLAAVSMKRVATHLGATTMALYRHVSSKDELLALMADAVFDTPPDAPQPGEDWRAGLTGWAHAHLAVLREHPWVLQIAADGPPAMPHQLSWLDRALAAFDRTGLTPPQRLSAVMLVSGYVRNTATQEAVILTAARAQNRTPGELMTSYQQQLARLVDPGRLPALHAVITATDISEPHDEFTFGLDRILDGLADLVVAGPTPAGGSQNVPRDQR